MARRLHHPQPIPRQNQEAFDKRKRLPNLLLDPHSSAKFASPARLAQRRRHSSQERHPGTGILDRAQLSDAFRSERLPANLLQAQRDYFGAHTYERIDRERGEFSTPTGPARRSVSSTTYDA